VRQAGIRVVMPADPQSRRDQQRERMRDAVDRKAQAARVQAEEQSLQSPNRPQEQLDVRAKNSGHKKKTADKWNQ
jgi:hypothetical protein